MTSRNATRQISGKSNKCSTLHNIISFITRPGIRFCLRKGLGATRHLFSLLVSTTIAIASHNRPGGREMVFLNEPSPPVPFPRFQYHSRSTHARVWSAKCQSASQSLRACFFQLATVGQTEFGIRTNLQSAILSWTDGGNPRTDGTHNIRMHAHT